MKKVLFSLFLFSAMAVGVQAQSSSCAKACAAKPAGTSCDSKSAASADAAAAKLASTDASIEAKTCPGTDKICYVRKVSEKNGSVSYVDVSYDATSNTFVNVSPSKANEASCAPHNTSGAAKTGCAAGATSISGSKSPACCAGKSKTASSTTSSGGTTTTAPSKG